MKKKKISIPENQSLKFLKKIDDVIVFFFIYKIGGCGL